MKKPLVLRSETLSVKLKNNALKLKKHDNDYIIALRHIGELYIFERIGVSLRVCRMIAEHIPVYIIDARGNVVARICKDGK